MSGTAASDVSARAASTGTRTPTNGTENSVEYVAVSSAKQVRTRRFPPTVDRPPEAGEQEQRDAGEAPVSAAGQVGLAGHQHGPRGRQRRSARFAAGEPRAPERDASASVNTGVTTVDSDP